MHANMKLFTGLYKTIITIMLHLAVCFLVIFKIKDNRHAHDGYASENLMQSRSLAFSLLNTR